jgi:hypothetical protein
MQCLPLIFLGEEIDNLRCEITAADWSHMIFLNAISYTCLESKKDRQKVLMTLHDRQRPFIND